MSREILLLVDALAHEKNVAREVIFTAVELALASATKKKYDVGVDIRVEINQETGEIWADVLREEWGPTRNVRWIMSVLYTMFLTEGASHSVEQEIMKQKEENYDAFKAKVAAQIAELME